MESAQSFHFNLGFASQKNSCLLKSFIRKTVISMHVHQVAQSCTTLSKPVDCSLPHSSVHGVLSRQEYWVDCHALLQGIFQPRNWTCITCVSCIGKQVLYHWHHPGSPTSISWIKKKKRYWYLFSDSEFKTIQNISFLSFFIPLLTTTITGPSFWQETLSAPMFFTFEFRYLNLSEFFSHTHLHTHLPKHSLGCKLKLICYSLSFLVWKLICKIS